MKLEAKDDDTFILSKLEDTGYTDYNYPVKEERSLSLTLKEIVRLNSTINAMLKHLDLEYFKKKGLID